MLRTLILVLVFALAVVVVLPWLILWSLLTGSQELMYRSSMMAVRSGLHLIGVRVRLEGMENIPEQPCIFAANHVSYIDPLALVPLLPRRVALPLKKELFRIPILGYGMRLTKFIPVDRSSREASARTVRTAVSYLNQGISFAMYPEGTRSPDGRLLPFKRGAFVIAMQAGVPIVPVSIAGAQNLLPKGEWAIRPGEVLIRFGQPVDVSQYPVARRAELLTRVHDLIAEGLPPEQQPLSRPAQAAI